MGEITPKNEGNVSSPNSHTKKQIKQWGEAVVLDETNLHMETNEIVQLSCRLYTVVEEPTFQKTQIYPLVN